MLATTETGHKSRFLMDHLHVASRSLAAAAERGLSDLNLTVRQVAVLNAVEAQPGASQTDVGILTGIDRSTLADIVRRLVDRRKIHRVKTPSDNRVYALTITKSGDDVRQRANAIIASVEAQISAKFRAGMQDDLDKIIATARQSGPLK